MTSLSILSTLEEVIPVSDEDLRAGIGSLAPQIVTEYVFYLRNVEREIRSDKDVAVVENVRLKREFETLQNELDRNRTRGKLNYDAPAPPSAPPQYDALPDHSTPSCSGLSLSAGDSQPSSSTNRPVVQIEISSIIMKWDVYIYKIFNQKYHGPLFSANDLAKGKYKLALVNERYDYEDGGKEIMSLWGPRVNEPQPIFNIMSEFGTLFCDKNIASFAEKKKVDWVIKKMSDGAYMIYNWKTGQALKCDDAKDDRGNHQVRAIKPRPNDKKDGSNRWILQLMKNPINPV
ncbi:uncharacterized protein LOC134816791 [Bolinopsis microptera]|uniref:uncharacterized protein LOC134816791 n=1 Tax=Bolinopsis microptera TaxID=2820187 RepID=UPI00307946CB